MAEAASEGQLRTALGRAVGIGRGHDGEAVVRTPGRFEGGATIRKNPGDLRTPTTAISSRTYGWWRTWKYRQGIRRRRHLRSRSCGRSWTERRSLVIRVFCGATASGETSGR